jgi:AcrR family transcriptional regulator
MARPTLTIQQRRALESARERQLLRGMAATVSTKGYAATTIADIVRHARVSKSTFYVHFADKEQCYVELYSRAADNVIARMEAAAHAAAADDRPWREHVRAVNGAYLQTLAQGGGLTWSMFVELPAAGPSALTVRREVFERYAGIVHRISARLRRREPSLRRVTPDLALGIVGSSNELVLRAIEAGSVASLPTLVPTISEMWWAVLASRR